MTREEAIEIVKKLYNDSLFLKKDKEAMLTLVPELAENDDERIREEMIRYFTEMKKGGSAALPYDACITYLEKQKEQKSNVLQNAFDKSKKDYTLEEKSKASDYAESILPTSVMYGESEEEYKLHTIIEAAFIAGQKEQKQEWKPEPESLESLMYAIEGKWDRISPTSYLSRRLEDLYEGLVNTFNVDESLIAELPKVASRAYTAEDIEELRELKHKIEASMEQKPAEWSEEDERKYQCIRNM